MVLSERRWPAMTSKLPAVAVSEEGSDSWGGRVGRANVIFRFKT
jgi:hypothetical protein